MPPRSSTPPSVRRHERLTDRILEVNREQRHELAALRDHASRSRAENDWLRRMLFDRDSTIRDLDSQIRVQRGSQHTTVSHDHARDRTAPLVEFILSMSDTHPSSLKARIEDLMAQHRADRETIRVLTEQDSDGQRREIARLNTELGRWREEASRPSQRLEKAGIAEAGSRRPKVTFTTVHRAPPTKGGARRA